MEREPLTLTDLARVGFVDLGEVRLRLTETEELGGPLSRELIPLLSKTADPDAALGALVALLRQGSAEIFAILSVTDAAQRLIRVLGASQGLADFFLRHPDELPILAAPILTLPTVEELTTDLLESVGAVEGFSTLTDDAAWVALRVRYRRRLAGLLAGAALAGHRAGA